MENSGNNTTSADFARVLFALKQNIFRDMRVADVAMVQSSNFTKDGRQDGTYTCTSLTTGEAIIAYGVDNLIISSGDIVVILFCDADFRANLAKAKAGASFQSVFKNEKTDLHTSAFAVIVGQVKSVASIDGEEKE